MAQLHMSEAEVVRDIREILRKVSDGTSVIVDQEGQALAVIMPISAGNTPNRKGPGRPIDECIALAKARNSDASLDDEFARSLEEAIARAEPFDSSVWD